MSWAKELVFASVTPASMIEATKKADNKAEDEAVSLERVQCIYYSLRFWKNTADIEGLIDFSSKVNAMIPAFAFHLGLKVWHTNVGTQKIDGSTLKIFRMALARFWIEDKLSRHQFY